MIIIMNSTQFTKTTTSMKTITVNILTAGHTSHLSRYTYFGDRLIDWLSRV